MFVLQFTDYSDGWLKGRHKAKKRWAFASTFESTGIILPKQPECHRSKHSFKKVTLFIFKKVLGKFLLRKCRLTWMINDHLPLCSNALLELCEPSQTTWLSVEYFPNYLQESEHQKKSIYIVLSQHSFNCYFNTRLDLLTSIAHPRQQLLIANYTITCSLPGNYGSSVAGVLGLSVAQQQLLLAVVAVTHGSWDSCWCGNAGSDVGLLLSTSGVTADDDNDRQNADSWRLLFGLQGCQSYVGYWWQPVRLFTNQFVWILKCFWKFETIWIGRTSYEIYLKCNCYRL